MGRYMASSLGIIMALYVVFTVIIITLGHWYTIMLALKASAQRQPVNVVCDSVAGLVVGRLVLTPITCWYCDGANYLMCRYYIERLSIAS